MFPYKDKTGDWEYAGLRKPVFWHSVTYAYNNIFKNDFRLKDTMAFFTTFQLYLLARLTLKILKDENVDGLFRSHKFSRCRRWCFRLPAIAFLIWNIIETQNEVLKLEYHINIVLSMLFNTIVVIYVQMHR